MFQSVYVKINQQDRACSNAIRRNWAGWEYLTSSIFSC